MRKPLPVLRPLILAAALPLAGLTCIHALGPARAARAVPAAAPAPADLRAPGREDGPRGPAAQERRAPREAGLVR